MPSNTNPLVRRKVVEAPPAEPAYDPAEHKVAEVVEYALGCEPEEIMRLRREEATGRKRSTLLAELDSMLA
jgi:hypothetical protein